MRNAVWTGGCASAEVMRTRAAALEGAIVGTGEMQLVMCFFWPDTVMSMD